MQESAGINSIGVASDSTTGPLIGEVSNGHFYVKQGGLEASWTEESPPAAPMFSLAG